MLLSEIRRNSIAFSFFLFSPHLLYQDFKVLSPWFTHYENICTSKLFGIENVTNGKILQKYFSCCNFNSQTIILKMFERQDYLSMFRRPK